MREFATYDEAVAAFDEAMKKTLGEDELRHWLAEDCAEALFGGNTSQ